MLKRKNLTIEQSPVSAENLGRLVELIETNVISGKIAKDVFEIMSESGEAPEKSLKKKVSNRLPTPVRLKLLSIR